MRSLAGIGLLLLSVIAFVACDSEEPTKLKDRNSDIIFTGGGSSIPTYYGWELFEDSDLDGVPDGPVSLYCEQILDSGGVPVLRNANSTPWYFTTEITVLKGGEVFPRTEASSVSPVTSSSDIFMFENNNMVAYDDSSVPTSVSRDPVEVTSAVFECSNSSLPCDPADPSTCSGGVCRVVGVCDVDSSVDCFVSPPTFNPCLFTDGSTCDCVALGFGICCTQDEIDMGNPACTGVDDKVDSCSDDATGGAIKCTPGCTELGGGSVCDASSQTRTFVFGSNPPDITNANRALLSTTENLFSFIDPALLPSSVTDDTPPFGICPGVDLGDPGIRSAGQPFSLKLDKGDTIIVQARRLLVPPPGIDFPTDDFPDVRALFFVDGVRLDASQVNGPTSTGTELHGEINFTFTVR